MAKVGFEPAISDFPSRQLLNHCTKATATLFRSDTHLQWSSDSWRLSYSVDDNTWKQSWICRLNIIIDNIFFLLLRQNTLCSDKGVYLITPRRSWPPRIQVSRRAAAIGQPGSSDDPQNWKDWSLAWNTPLVKLFFKYSDGQTDT